jgi:hypothetical protein
MTEQKNEKKANPESLRADYVNQLNQTNAQLGHLEGEKQRLIAYREQLKGAIFALDQVLQAQSTAVASATETNEAKANEAKAE